MSLRFNTKISSERYANYPDPDINNCSHIKIEASAVLGDEEVDVLMVSARKLHMSAMNKIDIDECLDFSEEFARIGHIMYSKIGDDGSSGTEGDCQQDLYEKILFNLRDKLRLSIGECGYFGYGFDIVILDSVVINPRIKEVKPYFNIDYIIEMLTRMSSPEIQNVNNNASLVFMNPFPVQYGDRDSEYVKKAISVCGKGEIGYSESVNKLISYLLRNDWKFENPKLEEIYNNEGVVFKDETYIPKMVKYYYYE